MPIANPAEAKVFNDDYPIMGEYVTDDSRIPYYNPEANNQLVLPGEPLLIKFGKTGDAQAMMAQGPIRPGAIGMLARYFTGDFPCDFSADVVMGTEVMWDVTANKVSLAADVLNGFVLGNISYALTSDNTNDKPDIDGNGRVICGTSTSTKCRVIGNANHAATVKGTVTTLSLPGSKAAAKKVSK